MILLFYLLFIPALCLAQSKHKPVTTFLNAKWNETPLLLEAAEYMADENSATFWSFIDAVNSQNLIEYAQKTDKGKFDVILEVASNFLSSSQIKLLKFSLSLRVYSPKIESFHQMALDSGIQDREGCKVAVEFCQEIICNIKDIGKQLEKDVTSCSNIYTIDHHYPGGETNMVTAILYGEIGTPEFKAFHDSLKELSNSGKLNYILRPFKKDRALGKVRLSGYGVELQIKSTEYKAQDDTKLQEEGSSEGTGDEAEREVEGFIFSKLKTLYPENEEQLNNLKSHLIESSNEMAPLKVWQLQHLSMQAAQRIMASAPEEMLNIFTHTSQNFPGLARSLTRTKVEEKMKSEIIKNQNTLRSQIEISPTDASLFVNGMQFDLDFTDIYTLLDHVKNEQRVMEGLYKLGIKGDTASTLLNLDFSEAKTEYGIDIRDSAIVWMNDIEQDKAYRKWPSSINELLRPMYPGMLRSIRKNLHNLVIIGDPSKKETIDIFKMIDGFLNHVSPIRFGIVLAVSSDKKVTGFQDAGVALLCAYNYVVQSFEDQDDSNYKGLQFLIDFYATVEGEISPKHVTDFFTSRYKSEDIEDVFGFDSDFDVGRQLAGIFVDKGGFKSLPQALMNGIPLPEKHLSSDEFEELMLMEVMKNTQVIQKAVYKGDVDDGMDVIDWLMSHPYIMPRLNNRILSNKNSKFIDMAGTSKGTIASMSVENFNVLTSSEMTALIGNSCRYITYKMDSILRPLTVLIVGDYESEKGRQLLLEAMKYTRESNGIRICGLSNSEKPGIISRAVEIAQATLSPLVVRQFLVKILDPINADNIAKGTKDITDFIVTEKRRKKKLGSNTNSK